MFPHGLVFHVHDQVDLGCQCICKFMQRIRGHSYFTFYNMTALLPELRIRTIFTIIFQPGSIQVFPGVPLIAFLITKQIITVDQTVEQPDLEEPWFLVLLNNFFAFQVDTDKYLV